MNGKVPMDSSLARLLRGWRTARRLSMGALAASAGVAKATISGWEAGTHQPRMPELHAVLAALEVTPGQQRRALMVMNAPRSRRMLKQAGTDVTAMAVAACGSGELLRAMRLRRGLSLEQVARGLGVWRSSVSRWEQAESLPTLDHQEALLNLFGAGPAEREALRSSR